MKYPQFFDAIAPIKLKDPLAEILGAFEGGEYEISYIEVVKAAGHSCPTVAGAYLMTKKALEVLYPEQRALRGNIKVEFAQNMEEGVAGVIGNVVSHITGATDKSGFKGLNGKFARHSLMFFGSDISSSGRFSRVDSQESVEIVYDPSSVAQNPMMAQLMQKVMKQEASKEEVLEFGKLWQARVEEIFKHQDDVLHVKQ